MSLTLICHPSQETNYRMLCKLGLYDVEEVAGNPHFDEEQMFLVDMDELAERYRKFREFGLIGQNATTPMSLYGSTIIGDLNR